MVPRWCCWWSGRWWLMFFWCSEVFFWRCCWCSSDGVAGDLGVDGWWLMFFWCSEVFFWRNIWKFKRYSQCWLILLSFLYNYEGNNGNGIYNILIKFARKFKAQPSYYYYPGRWIQFQDRTYSAQFSLPREHSLPSCLSLRYRQILMPWSHLWQPRTIWGDMQWRHQDLKSGGARRGQRLIMGGQIASAKREPIFFGQTCARSAHSERVSASRFFFFGANMCAERT